VREPKLKGKSYDIPKRLLWDAWLKVKDKGGAAGADGVTIAQFEEDLSGNLYRLWNRMSSGSYFPGPVRAVEIPKKGKKGGVRVLGIPNVVDRVAQTAAAMALEPNVERRLSVSAAEHGAIALLRSLKTRPQRHRAVADERRYAEAGNVTARLGD